MNRFGNLRLHSLSFGPILKKEDFYKVPSLVQLASIRTVGQLCLVVKPFNNHPDKQAEVEQLLLSLRIPSQPLLDYITGFISPVGFELAKWGQLYRSVFTLDLTIESFLFANGLHWTWCGVLDRTKMAQLLLADVRLPVRLRFQVACHNCFESQILNLWQDLSADDKAYFNRVCESRTLLMPGVELLWYWTSSIKGEVHNLLIRNPLQGVTNERDFALHVAANRGIFNAFKHFHGKFVAGNDVRFAIGRYAKMVYSSRADKVLRVYFEAETVIFLFSIADGVIDLLSPLDGRLATFSSDAVATFSWWPFQDLFALAFNLHKVLCEHVELPEEDILKAVGSLFMQKALDVSTYDWHYSTMSTLWHLWDNLNTPSKESIASSLLLCKRVVDKPVFERYCKIIVPVANTEELLLSDRGVALCVELLNESKWSSLRVFLSQLMPRDIKKVKGFEAKVLAEYSNARLCDGTNESFDWDGFIPIDIDKLSRFRDVIQSIIS